MGLDKKQVFGCFKTEKETERMKSLVKALIVMMAISGFAFMGCDNPANGNGGGTGNVNPYEIPVEFRGVWTFYPDWSLDLCPEENQIPQEIEMTRNSIIIDGDSTLIVFPDSGSSGMIRCTEGFDLGTIIPRAEEFGNPLHRFTITDSQQILGIPFGITYVILE